MDKTLKFIKLANRWFVHLPEFPGQPDDLEMVLGADALCDMIDTHNMGIITVTISTEPNENKFTTKEYILDFMFATTLGDEQDGAYYQVHGLDLQVWLCNVTKYVFNEFPKTIYIKY